MLEPKVMTYFCASEHSHVKQKKKNYFRDSYPSAWPYNWRDGGRIWIQRNFVQLHYQINQTDKMRQK